MICASGALQDGGDGVRFTVRRGEVELPAFVVRHGGVVHAYINRCAHVPIELDWLPGHADSRPVRIGNAAYRQLQLDIFGLLSRLAGADLYWTTVAMRLPAVLALVILAFALPALARRVGVDPRLALWAGLLNPVILVQWVGGVHNDALIYRLMDLLPGWQLDSTDALGLHPDWVEAIAFAWLAKSFLDGRAGNLSAVTGASRQAILGCLCPAR